MAHAPGPQTVRIAWPEINFERVERFATAIRETNTRLATPGDRQRSAASGGPQNDDQLPPAFFSVYMVEMASVSRQPVDAMRLGRRPYQTVKDA